jgi:hypothetical protein
MVMEFAGLHRLPLIVAVFIAWKVLSLVKTVALLALLALAGVYVFGFGGMA